MYGYTHTLNTQSYCFLSHHILSIIFDLVHYVIQIVLCVLQRRGLSCYCTVTILPYKTKKKSLLLLLYLLDFSQLNETESHVYPITFNKACALPYVKLYVYETGLKLRVQSTQYKDQKYVFYY